MAGGQRWSLHNSRPFRYKGQGGQSWSLDKMRQGDEPTISAGRFAEMTGVSRERLRTWERRHGFPRPVRAAGRPAPLPGFRRRARRGGARSDRVGRARRPRDRARTPDAGATPPPASMPAPRARSSAHLPLPLVIVAGPEPLVVEYRQRGREGQLAAARGRTVARRGSRARRRAAARRAAAGLCGPRGGRSRSSTRRGAARARVFSARCCSGCRPRPERPPACAFVSIDAERERRDRRGAGRADRASTSARRRPPCCAAS